MSEFTMMNGKITPARKKLHKYQHILELKSVDEGGKIVVYEHTEDNYDNIAKNLLFRLNKKYAPKRWAFELRDGKILVQRIK